MVFVREHRIVRQAQFLSTLDLGIPIGTLDQATHKTHFVLARKPGDVLDQLECACLIRLHGQTQAAPLRTVLGHQADKLF